MSETSADTCRGARLIAMIALCSIAVANLGFAIIVCITASPERRMPLAIAAFILLNVGVSLLICWSAERAEAGKFAFSIGLLTTLSFLHTIVPSAVWLAGRHEGGHLMMITQAAYACSLLGGTVTVIICARRGCLGETRA